MERFASPPGPSGGMASVGVKRLSSWPREKRRAQFDALVRPHTRSLYRTALRLVGDSHSAEDLMQETCLKAYRAFDSFEDGTNFRAWLFRIMSNLSIDQARRNARAPFVVWDEAEVSQAVVTNGSEPDQPDVHFLHKSFRDDAFRAIAKLTPDVRLVVSLALIEGFSYQEIADVAGCPVGTVRSRLNRGRQVLRSELRDYVPHDDESEADTSLATKNSNA